MLLQLNTTCDACTNDCLQSTVLENTLIKGLEDCISPIYYVVDTIAKHSSKLLITVKHLQKAIRESKNDDIIVSPPTNVEVDDLCLCKAP